MAVKRHTTNPEMLCQYIQYVWIRFQGSGQKNSIVLYALFQRAMLITGQHQRIFSELPKIRLQQALFENIRRA